MNDDGSCNTSILESSVKEISDITNKRKTLVIKSTVPPGTTFNLQEKYKKFDIFFNPEFLTQARFVEDFLEQDRIVIAYPKNGSSKNIKSLANLYHHFVEKRSLIMKYKKIDVTIWMGDSNVAEMSKYVGNSFLAAKVSFFNEMYEICEAAGIDYKLVCGIVQTDKRIGSSHMKVPGSDGKFGFSGACFPKDVNGLIAFAKDNGADPLVLESIWSKNLLVREDYEWENLPQANGKYEKK
jgi:UDPglucose 6-dehydrogenase